MRVLTGMGAALAWAAGAAAGAERAITTADNATTTPGGSPPSTAAQPFVTSLPLLLPEAGRVSAVRTPPKG